jgi:hypothetical protein
VKLLIAKGANVKQANKVWSVVVVVVVAAAPVGAVSGSCLLHLLLALTHSISICFNICTQ